jgi:hypothetical protein
MPDGGVPGWIPPERPVGGFGSPDARLTARSSTWGRVAARSWNLERTTPAQTSRCPENTFVSDPTSPGRHEHQTVRDWEGSSNAADEQRCQRPSAPTICHSSPRDVVVPTAVGCCCPSAARRTEPDVRTTTRRPLEPRQCKGVATAAGAGNGRPRPPRVPMAWRAVATCCPAFEEHAGPSQESTPNRTGAFRALRHETWVGVLLTAM